MSEKKPGRPTDLVKDSLLKLRVNADTIASIDKVARESSQTRSEIIREVLPVISSKDFEDMISLGSLQRLEQYSIECDKYFSKSGTKIKLSDVSPNYPAFVTTSDVHPTLFIKYPTYKIRILLPHQYNVIERVIQPILKDIKGISAIYETPCVLINSDKQEQQDTFLPELMCLKFTLEENMKLKDDICFLLNQNNILYEVWPTYCLVSKSVKIETEQGIDYVVSY